MAEKAKVVNLNLLPQEKQIDLNSGRQIKVKQIANEEILEIVEAEGELLLKIRLTEDGPILSIQGVKLELNSSESIKLDAKNIEINASQQTTLKSQGNLSIESTDKLDIQSTEDIVVNGKMIHLN